MPSTDPPIRLQRNENLQDLGTPGLNENRGPPSSLLIDNQELAFCSSSSLLLCGTAGPSRYSHFVDHNHTIGNLNHHD
jgi:hypothetical protein